MHGARSKFWPRGRPLGIVSRTSHVAIMNQHWRADPFRLPNKAAHSEVRLRLTPILDLRNKNIKIFQHSPVWLPFDFKLIAHCILNRPTHKHIYNKIIRQLQMLLSMKGISHLAARTSIFVESKRRRRAKFRRQPRLAYITSPVESSSPT